MGGNFFVCLWGHLKTMVDMLCTSSLVIENTLSESYLAFWVQGEDKKKKKIHR